MVDLNIRENMKMKDYKFVFTILSVVIILILSCSKKIVPQGVQGSKNDDYDDATFNYYYVEAIKQKLFGNSGDALKYLEQAVKINAKSDAAYYQMAQIVSANGDLTNGKRFIRRALEINDKNIWYLMMIGGFYYQERNLDSAIYYYETALRYFPEEENLQLTLGNLYSESKNYGKALDIFNSFDEKYGVNESSTVSAIRTLIEEKNYEEALVKTKLLIKEFPDEILYHGLLAEIYREQGENEDARNVYNELIKNNPDDPRVQMAICDFLITQKEYSELFSLLSNVVLNNAISRDDKISLFARLIELPEIVKDYNNELFVSLMVLEAGYGNDDIIPLLRPELMIKLSRLKEAAERLEEIINKNPDNYFAWEKLLLIYNQMGDFKNLMKRGEECSSRFNRSFLAKVLYANGAIESGEYDVALEELRKAEILAGDNKEYMTQVLTMRADVYYRMKDFPKAFETFETAIMINGEDLTILNNYAYYLAEQNRNLKEAEAMAKKVIEKEGKNNTFLDTYAWVLYKRGKLKEAADVMERIINSGEKADAEWYEHYGFILKKQRKCSKAAESWNMALKLDSTKYILKTEIQNCGK